MAALGDDFVAVGADEMARLAADALKSDDDLAQDSHGPAKKSSKIDHFIVPTPRNFSVNLPPLFLGHFSAVLSVLPSGNRHQDPKNGYPPS